MALVIYIRKNRSVSYNYIKSWCSIFDDFLSVDIPDNSTTLLYIYPSDGKNGLPFVNFNAEVLEATNRIGKNTSHDYINYSDSALVIVMRGFPFRDNLPGMSQEQSVQNLVRIAMTSKDTTSAYYDIISNAGRDTLIILSLGTSAWLSGTHTFVQFPLDKFILSVDLKN
jgi:hypothetical protein